MSIKTVAVATSSLAVIAFAGVTAYSSKAANQVIDEMSVGTTGGQRLIKLEQLERDNGWLKSSGLFSVALDANCLDADVSLPEVPAQIRYLISHLPDAKGLSSYAATIELTGEAGEAFGSVTGQKTLLTLTGEMGFNGQWTHRSRSPEITFDRDGYEVAIAASEGEVTGAEMHGAAAFVWSLPSISISRETDRFEMTGLSAAGVIDDTQLGLGRQTIGIERIEMSGEVPAGAAMMSGLRFDYETVAADGRIATSFQPSVNLVRVGGNTFQDLMFKMQLSGIDEQSLREINQVTRNQCQAQMNDEQLNQIERAILRIIDKGVSFSITDINGRQQDNSFDGQLTLILDDRGDGTNGPVLNMRERLSVSGQMSASQELAPPPLLDMLVQQGYAELNGSLIEASLSLDEGKLLINQANDAHGFGDTVDFFLVMAEEGMSNWHEQIAAGNGPLVTLARAARQP